MRCRQSVSNPISGEVGAAATSNPKSTIGKIGFKPHQRGGGCCSLKNSRGTYPVIWMFQTPSAGRWVLQLTANAVVVAAIS